MANRVFDNVQIKARNQRRQEYEFSVADAEETRQYLRDNASTLGTWVFEYSTHTSIDETLHDLWDQLIFAAKILPPNSAELDRLVTLVLELRELGPLTRQKESGIGLEPAMASNGQRIWADLPYLADVIRDFWKEESMNLEANEFESLAALTAKLFTVGACGKDLSSCVSQLFRDTFEVDIDEDKLEYLLPACLQCLKISAPRLLRLCCDESHSTKSVNLSSPTKSVEPEVQGYTIQGWLSWRRATGELYKLHGNQSSIGRAARGCFEILAQTGASISVSVPGEKQFITKVFDTLDKELAARGNKGSVNLDEIEIDPSWVESE